MLSAKGRVGEMELRKYREMDCAVALPLLADYVKADDSFVPILTSHTHRWHLVAKGRQFELLTTGAKWFDTREQRGGGGAVDLTMHLFQADFKQAVALLRDVTSQNLDNCP